MITKRIRRALRVYRGAIDIAFAGREHAGSLLGQTKSLPTRLLDNLRWAHAKREANTTYYLYGLHRKDGPAAEQFMGDREAMRIVARQLAPCREHYDVLRDKLRFFETASRLGARTPEVVYACSPEGIRHVASGAERAWDEVVREQTGRKLFAKPARGAGGEGGGRITFRGGDALFEGRKMTDEVIERFAAKRYILQRLVVQHPAMARFNPDCLNTLRIVTIARGEGGTDIVPLAGFLRIGAPGSPTDNWATGGIAVALDLERGTLSGRGLFKKRGEQPVATDPRSGVIYDGYEIPYLRETIAELCALHGKLGCLRSVGWDVAIEPGGACVVEANTYWGVMFFQAVDHRFKQKYLAALEADRLA